jgi:uroporphyrinogen decarboxylase
MTSRERVLAAVERKPIDKLPVDFGATRSGGISAISYNHLKKKCNVDDDTLIYDIQQQLAWPGQWLLDRYNIDVIDAGRAFLKEKSEWRRFDLNDGSFGYIPDYHKTVYEDDGNIYLLTNKGTRVGIKTKSSLYFDQCYWPWKDFEEIPADIKKSDFEEQLWDVPSSPFHLDIIYNKDDREKFGKVLKDFYKSTDKAVLLDFGIAGFFECPGYMRGMQNWFTDLLIDEEGRERILDVYLQRCLERLEIILGYAGDSIDILRLFWDDMGSQGNLLLPPDLFKKSFAPRYRILTDYIHSHSKCKVMLHSCGSVYKIIGSLIDAGIDILNPVQTSCAEMDPKVLKREFGKDLTFWGGGCDTVLYLAAKTPDEVAEHIKERIDIFGKDEGFIFAQTHNIQPDVPVENIVVLLETVKKVR